MATPPPGIPTSTNGTHKTGENEKVCLIVFQCKQSMVYLIVEKSLSNTNNSVCW
jgi:hypothetical protein